MSWRQREEHVELLPVKSPDKHDGGAAAAASPPPNPDYAMLSKRTPASKRLQVRSGAPACPASSPAPLAVLSGAPPPSRRREELAAFANLRKKVAPQLLAPAIRNQRRVVTTAEPQESERVEDKSEEKEPEPPDNRPKLLQKVLSARPVSVVVQWSEVRTAWQDSDFISDCLCWHNVYRQRHGAPVLVMAPELCDYAQTWANHLAHTNKFHYRNDSGHVGQNLYQRPVTALQPDVTGQEVSSYWYATVRQYNYFKEPDVLHTNVNAGPFAQMVWVSTRLFGVGKARSRAGKVIVVANYSPPGNASGHFQTNVLVPVPETGPDPGSACPSN